MEPIPSRAIVSAVPSRDRLWGYDRAGVGEERLLICTDSPLTGTRSAKKALPQTLQHTKHLPFHTRLHSPCPLSRDGCLVGWLVFVRKVLRYSLKETKRTSYPHEAEHQPIIIPLSGCSVPTEGALGDRTLSLAGLNSVRQEC